MMFIDAFRFSDYVFHIGGGRDGQALPVRQGGHQGLRQRPPAAPLPRPDPDDEALVEIATLRILAGSLPRRVEREALAWARAHLDTIRAEWNRINPRFPIA